MSRNERSYENYKINKILQGSNKNRENCENSEILQNRYRNINEVEGGHSTKLRILQNLRKSRNFAKITKEYK